MGFLQKAAGWLSDLAGGGSIFSILRPTASGKIVTPDIAIQTAAAFCCVKILGETEAMLPLNVYQRRGDSTAKAEKHPLQWLLHDEPNPEMSAIDFRMSQTAQLAMHGNAYSRIARDSKKRPIALWPMISRNMRTDRTLSGDLVYRYQFKGNTETYSPRDILHLRTLSFDGINGIAPLSLCANSVGLTMALEEHAARFFSNGAIPAIALEHPQRLTPQAIQKIRDSWKSIYGGVENSSEVAVTEEGMKVTVLGHDPQKSQSIESRKFQIGEIARLFRMPLHMLADLERATFSNIEQQSLEFVVFTLMPWLEIWEQAINRSLFSMEEKSEFFVEHNVGGLLRGDLKSRYGAYAVGRQWGWLTVNNVLKLENMNPIGPEGDTYLTPLNFTASGEDPADPDKPNTEAGKAAVAAICAMMPHLDRFTRSAAA